MCDKISSYGKFMSWIYLLFAIVFEITGTCLIKLSDGFRNIVPTICLIISYVISFYFMSIASRLLDISTIYAIWSGIGILVISLIGYFFFHENLSFLKIFFIILILIGTVGLKFVSKH